MVSWAKFEGKLFSDPKCSGPLLQTLPLKHVSVSFGALLLSVGRLLAWNLLFLELDNDDGLND